MTVAVCLSACGGGVDPSTSIQGTWQWPFVSQELSLTSVITSNEFRVTADCRFGGVSLSATASSGAVIDDSSIRILGDAFRRESLNGSNCEAKIKAGTLGYALEGPDSLRLSAPGELPLTLTRVNR